jgi:hypothetical protein
MISNSERASADREFQHVEPGIAVDDVDQTARIDIDVVGLRRGPPREFADYIAREIPKWTKVVKDSGARAE